jgi:hypothetical protein
MQRRGRRRDPRVSPRCGSAPPAPGARRHDRRRAPAANAARNPPLSRPRPAQPRAIVTSGRRKSRRQYEQRRAHQPRQADTPRAAVDSATGWLRSIAGHRAGPGATAGRRPSGGSARDRPGPRRPPSATAAPVARTRDRGTTPATTGGSTTTTWFGVLRDAADGVHARAARGREDRCGWAMFRRPARETLLSRSIF